MFSLRILRVNSELQKITEKMSDLAGPLVLFGGRFYHVASQHYCKAVAFPVCAVSPDELAAARVENNSLPRGGRSPAHEGDRTLRMRREQDQV